MYETWGVYHRAERAVKLWLLWMTYCQLARERNSNLTANHLHSRRLLSRGPSHLCRHGQSRLKAEHTQKLRFCRPPPPFKRPRYLSKIGTYAVSDPRYRHRETSRSLLTPSHDGSEPACGVAELATQLAPDNPPVLPHIPNL